MTVPPLDLTKIPEHQRHPDRPIRSHAQRLAERINNFKPECPIKSSPAGIWTPEGFKPGGTNATI